MHYSQIQLPFLHILTMKMDTKIQIDIHYKPTESKQYLLFKIQEDEYSIKSFENNVYNYLKLSNTEEKTQRI